MSAIYNIQHLPDIHPLPIGTILPDDSEIVKVYDMNNTDKVILTNINRVTTSEQKLKEIDLENTNYENKQIFGYNQFLFEEDIIDVNNKIMPDIDGEVGDIPIILRDLYRPYNNYYYKIRNNNRTAFSKPKFEKWKTENLNGYPDDVKTMKRIPLFHYLRNKHDYGDEEKKEINKLIISLQKSENFQAYDYVKIIKTLSDLDIDNILRQHQLGGKNKKTKKRKTKKRKTKKKSKKNTKTRRRKV